MSAHLGQLASKAPFGTPLGTILLILGPLDSKIMDFRMIFFTCSFWIDVAKINQKSAKICQGSAKNQLVNDFT